MEFDRQIGRPVLPFKREVRINPSPFAEQSPIVQEAILVIAAKESKDIYIAKNRAEGCGCRNCHRDAEAVKEWYKN